jgi:serine protease Do
MTARLAISATQQDVARIADSLSELTVAVHGQAEVRAGEGAGVIWHPDGLVVTNAHCIRQREVRIRSASGELLDAEVVARERELDLAILEVPRLGGRSPTLADVESLRAGEVLIAYGHPLGVRGALALGVLHAVVRDARSGAPRWIAADIRLAPGNSGGPLVDAAGRIVGINTMIVGGLGLAIPTSVVQRFVSRVRPALAA